MLPGHSGWLCFSVWGFSLRAATRIEAAEYIGSWRLNFLYFASLWVSWLDPRRSVIFSADTEPRQAIRTVPAVFYVPEAGNQRAESFADGGKGLPGFVLKPLHHGGNNI